MNDDLRLTQHLLQFVTEARKTKFEEVLNYRTKYMTVVLENIFQPHNASAVMRTCDCFGVQDLHIIENDNEYNVNPDVVQGSSKWVDLYKYNSKENNTVECINHLKEEGYRIIGTTPHEKDQTIADFDINKGKFALLFGSEKPGISDLAKSHCDEFVKIPMYGFTESFNISVSAAIIMNQLRERLNTSTIDWQISKNEKDRLLLDWIRKTIERCDVYERDFFDQAR